MTTKSLTLDVPPALAQELDTVNKDMIVDILERGLRQLRVDRGLKKYAAGEMSFGAAAEWVGMSQSELAREAHARGVEPRFSEETLLEELA